MRVSSSFSLFAFALLLLLLFLLALLASKVSMGGVGAEGWRRLSAWSLFGIEKTEWYLVFSK